MMLSASPSASASSLAAVAHRRPRWTSPRATPSLPTTTMLSTLSSLHPRPRTKTRTSARRWRSKACVSAHSRTVPLPPTSVRRRVCQRIRRRCRCCRRRAVALPPPPQPPRYYNRTAAVALCSAAVLCAAAFTSTRGQHTAIP